MATMSQAIRMALHYGETYLGVKHIFGQDVGPPLGGVFSCTQGLKNTWNTLLDERGIIGTMIGLAYCGQKPVAEIQFVDYIFNSLDLIKIAGNTNWSSAGQFPLQLVLMTPSGSGIHGSPYHSHSFEAWAARLTGWKVVMPSTPIDAYGLMLAAIEDTNPVMFLIPKVLMRIEGNEKFPGEPDRQTLKELIDAPIGDRSKWKAKWPDTPFSIIPLGKANLVKEGRDGTVVSFGRTLTLCLQVAESLQKEGIEYDVIDLRSLIPYDWKMISHSILKTGRVLFVNEDTDIVNYNEHLLRRTIDEHFYHLEVRPRAMGGEPVAGIGLANNMEYVSTPQIDDILKNMKELALEEN